MCLNQIWPKPQRLAVACLRLYRPTERMQRSAEGEMSVDVRRIDGQDLAIHRLNLLQPSGPMVSESPSEQIIDRRVGIHGLPTSLGSSGRNRAVPPSR